MVLSSSLHHVSNLVQRPVRKRFDVKYTIPIMKHVPNIMAFCHYGTDGFYVLLSKTKKNAKRYLGLLNKLDIHLKIQGCSISMHSGAQIQDECEGLSGKEYTSAGMARESADLNPIENLCSVIKQVPEK